MATRTYRQLIDSDLPARIMYEIDGTLDNTARIAYRGEGWYSMGGLMMLYARSSNELSSKLCDKGHSVLNALLERCDGNLTDDQIAAWAAVVARHINAMPITVTRETM